jgi:sugar O-acyltransferase (sialic acid O-acetyltransferase NeuD family)
MSKPIVVFGFGNMAEVAHFYFTRDSDRTIEAFTIDRDFITEPAFQGLPVVPFDEVPTRFPAAEYDMFVAIGYSKVNAVRREKYLAVKSAGYAVASYVSRQATTLNEGRIGENCLILEDNTIQPYATIGNNVVLWSGNHIGHHSIVRDHCFLSSHIVVSGGVEVGESCFIGVNATLRDHIKVGERCVIGAGALILADTEPEGVYVGTATPRSPVPSSRLRKL